MIFIVEEQKKILLSKLCTLLPTLVLMVPIASINYSKIFYLSGILMLVSGLVFLLLQPRMMPLMRTEKLLIAAYLIYPAWVATDLLLRTGWIWNEFKEPSRFFLMLPVFFMIRQVGLSQTAFKWGVFGGAVLAGIWGIYQTQVMGIERAYGGTSKLVNAYGDIGLLLGILCVPLFQPQWRLQKIWGLVALTGFAFGIVASLASGTKASWVFLPLFCWIVVDLFEHPTYKKRGMAVLAFMVIGVLFYYWSPLVQGRLADVLPSMTAYFEDGQILERSTSFRLGLWYTSSLIFLDNPLFGVGPSGYQSAQAALIAAGLAPPQIGFLQDPHNQFFYSLVELGIFGPVMIFSIYGSFIYHCRKHAQANQSLAVAGILLAIGFIIFGMFESIWRINNAGVFFALMMVMIGGGISHAARSKKPNQAPTVGAESPP